VSWALEQQVYFDALEFIVDSLGSAVGGVESVKQPKKPALLAVSYC